MPWSPLPVGRAPSIDRRDQTIRGRRRSSMKLDITKLPLGEALIGFVLGAVVLTFVLAFAFPTESGLGDKTVTGSPTPGATPTPAETPSGTPAGGLARVLNGNNFGPRGTEGR